MGAELTPLHGIGLGHETMVCAVCLSIILKGYCCYAIWTSHKSSVGHNSSGYVIEESLSHPYEIAVLFLCHTDKIATDLMS